MTGTTEKEAGGFRFSIRMMLGWVVVIAIGVMPMAYFGWLGLISSVFLTLVGFLFLYRKFLLAVVAIFLFFFGQVFSIVFGGSIGSVHRTECGNQVRTLTIAIHEYEAKYGHIPPPYSIDENGKPLHSWRVLLLPFIGEQKLYDQIDKSKPWDHPVNVRFHDRMPDVFCCAAVRYNSKWRTTGNTTAYVVVVGDRTPWQVNNRLSLTQIPDGTANTIAIIESEPHRLPWMAPHDPNFESFIQSYDFSKPHHGLANFSSFDVSTQAIHESLQKEELSQLLIMDDGK